LLNVLFLTFVVRMVWVSSDRSLRSLLDRRDDRSLLEDVVSRRSLRSLLKHRKWGGPG
jgi:hypothetical protein